MRAGEMSAGSCWKGTCWTLLEGRAPAIGISLFGGRAVSAGCLAVPTRPLTAPYEFGLLSPTS